MDSAFDIAADLDTPVSAYLKLAPLGPRFLLESVEGGSRLGRYSFLGFGEGLDVRVQGDRLLIDDESLPIAPGRDGLLDALRGALARAPRPGPQVDGVPFVGGLVGATSYRMARRFDRVSAERHVAPTDLDGMYCAPRSILAFDHLSRRAALLHDGSAAERQALRREVIRTLRGPVPERKSRGGYSSPRPSIELPDFLDSVRRAQGQITAGEIYQIVLSIRFSGRTALAPFDTYRALRLLNPSPYMYFCEFGETSVIGSSPEALVRLDGRQATLRPIAGTRPRGSDPADDERLERELLADPKEAAEHVMLVDLARNDLGRVATTGSVLVDPFRSIERYSHVMHLVSGVRGVLAADRDAFDLFAASFPAGTVVGAPKIRAMELIDAHEPVGRGMYAGTVGYFGLGNTMDQAITIRTLVFSGDEFSFQAGAGIVADSVPEHEHAEILAKSAALAEALKLAEELQ